MKNNCENMKILNASKVYSIECDDGSNYVEYLRFSENNWYRWYGESLESVYECEDLEKAFNQTITNDELWHEPV